MDFTSREMDLQGAIESGDLIQVRQIVESGVNLNTVLHSVSRRESATVLGMAAFEGQFKIMQYLMQSGALANIKDPYFGRNALHWACQGGWLEAVQLLLQQKVDINCVDRDNVSPLLRAAMTGNVDIIRILIGHGADVNQQDRLRSSALHYSTFHGTSSVTSYLIRAGCIQSNTTIFGQGTPLANLIFHGDLPNSILLIEAGYSLEKESWLERYKDKINDRSDPRFSMCIREVLKARKTVPPLVRICRTAIRRVMTGSHLHRGLAQLPLPEVLILYLSMTS